MDKETLILTFMGLLVAPPILFGVWMRIKLMGSEQGQEFLINRETARMDAEDDARLLSDDLEERAGKIARMEADLEATEGAYGQDVASLVKKAVPFILGYFGYAIVIIAIMVFFIV